MKNLISFTLILIPVIVFAQGQPQYDQQQMQDMMQNAQKMQQCMQNIDKSEIQAFQQQGMQMEAEMKSLCAAGKRARALEKVISYSKQIATNPAIQEMKKCGEMMQGIMPDYTKIAEAYKSTGVERHICDNLQ